MRNKEGKDGERERQRDEERGRKRERGNEGREGVSL